MDCAGKESQLLHPSYRCVRCSSSGQAAIEYILILVVTVAILLMLLMQLFRPMQMFVQAYMGDYVECLLETGELPSLGGESQIQDDSCNARFEAVSLSKGRPAVSGGQSGAKNTLAEKSQSTGYDSNKGESTSRSGASTNRGLTRSPNLRGGGAEGPSIHSNKSVEIALDPERTQYRKVGRTDMGTNTKSTKSIKLDGYAGDQMKGRSLASARTAQIIASDTQTPAPKKIALKKSDKKLEQISETQASWSIGEAIRIFFILAIIILIIALFFGQAARLLKSWEK